MNFKQFVEQFPERNSRKPINVEFNAGVSDLEGYTEPKMRAQVVGVRIDYDDVVKIRVDYGLFDEFNKAFESANYWGRESNNQDPASATYTARETGWYKVEEELYVMADQEVSVIFTILDDFANSAYDRYMKEGADISYTAWLEQQLQMQCQG